MSSAGIGRVDRTDVGEYFGIEIGRKREVIGWMEGMKEIARQRARKGRNSISLLFLSICSFSRFRLAITLLFLPNFSSFVWLRLLTFPPFDLRHSSPFFSSLGNSPIHHFQLSSRSREALSRWKEASRRCSYHHRNCSSNGCRKECQRGTPELPSSL